PPVAREVAADPGPEVLGLADVQDPPGGVAEQVHAGAAGEPVGQVDLLEVGPGPGRGELDQVLEGQHPVGPGQLEQGVEHVDGRPGVGQGPVAGGDRRPQAGGQGGQADVGHLVAGEQLAGQPGRADDPVGQAPVAVALQVGLDEAPVEGGVVGHQHSAAEELEQAGEHDLDRLLVGHHRVGDAGQGADQRRDGDPGVDQGLEGADDLAPADLDRADLGDAVVGGRSAGGLQVEHDELDVDQRRAEVVEATLDGDGCGGPPGGSLRPLWAVVA